MSELLKAIINGYAMAFMLFAIIGLSGDIHRDLSLKNSMPNVCQVMRGLFLDGDLMIRTTPSGNSSMIAIRYLTGNLRE